MGLPTIIEGSSGNMHRWPCLCTNSFLVRMWEENEIQLNGITNAKKLLTNLRSCVLAHQFWPMQKPFRVHTDASILGLGAVIYQEQDGVEKVIRYASHSLSRSESKYPVHKLEFLCLKWAITD